MARLIGSVLLLVASLAAAAPAHAISGGSFTANACHSGR